MNGFPWIQFYVRDWIADTRSLTLAAKGAWIDILAALHNSETRGSLTLDIDAWARIVGAPAAETGNVLSEISTMRVGNVVMLSNSRVMVSCRRMLREEEAREKNRQRVANHRERKASKEHETPEYHDGNGECNGNVTDISQKPEARSHSTIPIHTDSAGAESGRGKAEKTELQQRVERLFRRRASTPWDSTTKKAWLRAAGVVTATSEEDWKVLEWFYSLPYEGTYRRRDLATLLNNWTAEIDRAHGHRGSKPAAFRLETQGSIYEEPPDWRPKAKRIWPNFDESKTWLELSATARLDLIR